MHKKKEENQTYITIITLAKTSEKVKNFKLQKEEQDPLYTKNKIKSRFLMRDTANQKTVE